MSEFTYFNIQDVDPSFKPVEQGVYTLQLAKVQAQDKTLASGKNAGLETKMIKITAIITDDPQFSGRRLFPTLWIHNSYDQKSLRKIADATGVTQSPGEALDDYCVRLSQVQPKVRAKVDVVDEKVYPAQFDENGQPVMAPTNKVDFRSVSAA